MIGAHHIKNGFTLIEMLVVMGIILALAGLILPFVNIGQSGADINETRILIKTVGVGIEQFTNDTGSVPLPTGSSTDAESGTWYPAAVSDSWDKQQLWWRLNHEMTTQERVDMRTAGEAADLAADPYQSGDYMSSQYPSTATRYTEVSAILATIDNDEMAKYKRGERTDWLNGYANGDVHTNGSYLSTRGKYKVWALNIRGTVAKDLAERAYMTSQILSDDDLGGSHFLKGNTIVDAWGQPLIYVAHSTVEVKDQRHSTYYYHSIGKKASGRLEIDDRNSDGVVDGEDWAIAPSVLQDLNNDGSTDINDWGNILHIARQGNGMGFYLASPGPDTAFNVILSEEANDDNVIWELQDDQ